LERISRKTITIAIVRLAVIGGGINGLGIAWELARREYDVTLFEKGRCGEQTSSATTKLIHGGIRYLEHFHFALVRESLRDRAWLLEHLPSLVRPIEILLPVYDDSPRGRFILRAGLTLYDLLAGRTNIARHKALRAEELMARVPLTSAGLRGGFSFHDAQVDDHALARLVAASAASDGATIREQTPVASLRPDGKEWIVATAGGEQRFDFVVNAAGPWMNAFLEENHLRSRYRLSLVRGSHLVLKHRVADAGMLLQSLNDRRVFFVLPWKGTTLVGTTEVMHDGSLEHVTASDAEIDYLITRYNRYLRDPIGRDDVASTFAGVRPLVGRALNTSAIDRDYRLERRDNLLNVFGGKMTTFRSMAEKAAMRVDNYFGEVRVAREAIFTSDTDRS
jgi:glycerol-3-phosphate dehydrogenase